MYLITGLGNPEKKYDNTRHNIGFNVINKISDKCDIKISHSKFSGLYGMGAIYNAKVILLKPQTYMNLSGNAIIQFKNFYKISNDNIIVIYDDVDLEVGSIRIKKQGSAGTHNGMRSVVENLGTEEFIRIRIGIGKPHENEDIADYVLRSVPKEEQEAINESASKAAIAVLEILTNDVDTAMNMFN